jgi:hypothetical protein
MDDNYPAVWVYGDSLTANKYNSWAVVLNRDYKCCIHHHARGGLRLVDLSIPEWVTGETDAEHEPDRICVYLGTNDALKGVDHAAFEEHLELMLHTLSEIQRRTQEAGDNIEITFIKPPTYSYNRDLLVLMAPIRRIVKNALRNYPEFEQVNMEWDNYQSLVDEYHPTEQLYMVQACQMAGLWGIERR